MNHQVVDLRKEKKKRTRKRMGEGLQFGSINNIYLFP